MAILFSTRRHHSLLLRLTRHYGALSDAFTGASTSTALPSPPPPSISLADAKTLLQREFDLDKVVSIVSSISSPESSPTTFLHVLALAFRRLARARRTADVEALVNTHKSSPHASQEPFLATLIHAYGTAGMPGRALSLFEQVPTLCSAPPTVVSFNAVLSACMVAKRSSRVPLLFTHLSKDHSIDPDARSYAILIKSLCQNGNPLAALDSLNEMEGKGYKPTVAIYTTILDSLFKSGKANETEKLWSSMLASGCTPDLTTYNAKSMYHALHGTPEAVRAVIADIESAGLKPDTNTYNTLITSYCKSGRFEDAEAVYKGLSVTGHSPNAATYDSFLLMLLEGGELDAGLGVYRDARRCKRIPSFTVMSRLVEELVKGSREEEARGLIAEVKERLPKELLVGWTKFEKKLSLGVEPDTTFSYETVIRSLCICGNVIAGVEKLIEMEGKGIVPTTAIYNTILHSLYKEGKLEEAEKLWSDMLGRGCAPDVTSYNVKAMYQALYGTPEEVRAVMAKIESLGLKPDTTTYNYLIISYCKKGLFEDAKGIYKGAGEMGWQPNVATFKNLLYFLCENGDLDAGLEVFNDSLKQNKIPFFTVTSLLVEGLVKGSREEEAKTVIGDMKKRLPKKIHGDWIKLERKLGLVEEPEVSDQFLTA